MMRQLREIPYPMLPRIVGLHVRAVSVFGKKSIRCGLRFFGVLQFRAILRFSDRPPSLLHQCVESKTAIGPYYKQYTHTMWLSDRVV